MFNIRYKDAEFEVCASEFPICFGPVFTHHVLFPSFWNGNAYSMPLFVGSVKFQTSANDQGAHLTYQNR